MFSLGLAIVISPCTYFLLPLVLALATTSNTTITKSTTKKEYYKQIFVFIIGFILGALIIYFLANVLKTLSIFNFIKLFLGIIFIVIGIYSIYKPVSITINANFNKNLFLTGVFIPIISSLSGCGLPFLATLSTISNVNLLLIIAFILGMLTPYLAIFIGGKLTTRIIQNFISKTHKIWDKVTSILFLLLGFYTLLTVGFFTIKDLTIILILVIIIFSVLCFKQCFLIKKRGFTKFLLATISFIFWSISISTCKIFSLQKYGPIENNLPIQNLINYYPHTCSGTIRFCPYCITCSIIFLITTIITTYTYINATQNDKN